MKLIERVYYSLIGKKIKSLLLLLVITILGAFLSASFSIYQANKSLEYNIKKSLTPSIIIEWERDNVNYNSLNDIVETLKKDDRLKYIENRYEFINSYNHISSMMFEFRDENNNPINDGGQYLNNSTACNFDNCLLLEYKGWKNIHAFDSTILSDIKNNEIALIHGRNFNESEVNNGNYVFINTFGYDCMDHFIQRLIDVNEYYITVDEIIVCDNNNQYSIVDFGYKQRFDMVGISKKTYYNNLSESKYHSSIPYGSLFVPYETMRKMNDELIKKIKELDEKYDYLNFDEIYETNQLYYMKDSYIEIKDIDSLDLFIDEIEEKYDNYIQGVYSSSDSYNDVKNITKNLSFIAIISLVTCSIASIVLLSLIIQVIVNERKYEIGVYLSMGEKRTNVIKQIVLEVLIIGLLGMTLSLFAGNMIASSLSSDLLERQIAQIKSDKDEFGTESSYEIDEKEIVNAYEVAINSEYVISVYAGGIIVLLISCIVPMNGIMKMKVKKMLM